MSNRCAAALAAGALLLLLAGCGGQAAGPAAPLEVTAGPDMKFTPATLSLVRGQRVRLTLTNADPHLLHDLTVQTMGVKGVRESGGAAHDHGHGKSAAALHVAAAAGKSAVVEFTPTEAGQFEFYCTVPGHREAGMKGAIHVQ